MRTNGLPTSCRLSSVALVIAALAANLSLAPSAKADPVDSLRNAVTQLRAPSCGGLRVDPIVEHAALDVNRSTQAWVDHTARAVPVPDPVPLLKDLGYTGGKAAMIFGAGNVDAAAIEGLLLQGYDKIPDCSYTDYGASVIRDQTTGYVLMTVVLAGP
jgi:hypothetical protein